MQPLTIDDMSNADTDLKLTQPPTPGGMKTAKQLSQCRLQGEDLMQLPGERYGMSSH